MKNLFVLLFLLPLAVCAQDDLLSMLQKEVPKTKDYALSVYKGNRIINCQSTEQPAKKVMQFIISHRFGRMGGSIKEFFGLDASNIRIGVEYGIIDNLSVGLGRSSFEKTYDGYVKWRIIRQQTGKWNIPITITAFTSMAITSNDWADPKRHNFFSSRLFYSYQLIISRKFGQWFSAQLMPTMIHRNLVHTVSDRNDVFALGAAVSVRISKRVRLNGEYFYVFPKQIISEYNNEKVRNCLSIGVDIETGGHVFQIQLSNSRGMIEKNYVTETTGNWFPKTFKDFGVQLGFNITRGFVIDPKAHKKAKEEAKIKNAKG
jgi:hypothetical protein